MIDLDELERCMRAEYPAGYIYPIEQPKLRALIAELRAARAVTGSLRELHCELKGAQLMIFEADTAEKRSAAFKCVGNVVAWLMQAERDLSEPPPPKATP